MLMKMVLGGRQLRTENVWHLEIGGIHLDMSSGRHQQYTTTAGYFEYKGYWVVCSITFSWRILKFESGKFRVRFKFQEQVEEPFYGGIWIMQVALFWQFLMWTSNKCQWRLFRREKCNRFRNSGGRYMKCWFLEPKFKDSVMSDQQNMHGLILMHLTFSANLVKNTMKTWFIFLNKRKSLILRYFITGTAWKSAPLHGRDIL
jgi:hypothetical protein